jgi:hypothetical protein
VLKLCYRGTGHTTSTEVTTSPVHSYLLTAISGYTRAV